MSLQMRCGTQEQNLPQIHPKHSQNAPKILDFRIFFVIFSMQVLECKLEGQKIEKKVAKNVFGPNFGAALRYVRSWGEGL